MVTTVTDPYGRGDRLVVTPYSPLSRRESVFVFLATCMPILAVAIICGMIGNWYVLPFSLAVIAAVGVGLRAGYRRTQIREVIGLVGAEVVIERGHRRSEERYIVPCSDLQLVLEFPDTETNSHLFVRANNLQLELGQFLDDKERCELETRLSSLIASCRSPATALVT